MVWFNVLHWRNGKPVRDSKALLAAAGRNVDVDLSSSFSIGHGFVFSLEMVVLELFASHGWKHKASLNRSIIDTVTKTGNLRTVPVECYGDDTPLIFHDILLFSLILLVHVSKFNVHDTPITLPLRLA